MPVSLKIIFTVLIIASITGIAYGATEWVWLRKIFIGAIGFLVGMLLTLIWEA